MKRIIALIGILGLFLRGRAQSFAEWFAQNKTEIKYLRAQVLALKEEDEVLDDGYAIDENGLTRIGSDKLADIRLHADYFSTLENVNPVIKADPRVNEILELAKENDRLAALISKAGGSFPVLQSSIGTICQKLTIINKECLSSLENLLQDQYAQLSDGQRRARLVVLYEDARQANALAHETYKSVYQAFSN